MWYEIFTSNAEYPTYFWHTTLSVKTVFHELLNINHSETKKNQVQ